MALTARRGTTVLHKAENIEGTDTVRCSPNYTYAKDHSKGARGHLGLIQVLYG